jgi:hypothetical protein
MLASMARGQVERLARAVQANDTVQNSSERSRTSSASHIGP